jgi:hypothetical protein
MLFFKSEIGFVAMASLSTDVSVYYHRGRGTIEAWHRDAGRLFSFLIGNERLASRWVARMFREGALQ